MNEFHEETAKRRRFLLFGKTFYIYLRFKKNETSVVDNFRKEAYILNVHMHDIDERIDLSRCKKRRCCRYLKDECSINPPASPVTR